MMTKSKKEPENKANEAARAEESALHTVQELNDDELELVAGGDSIWNGVPNPEEYPYPVNPDPAPNP